MIAALVACGLRVRHPGGSGNVSISYLFVLLALLDLNLRETFCIASLAVLILAAAQPRESRETLVATMTALLSTGTSVLASQWIFHLKVLGSEGVEPPIRFIIAAFAIYVGFNLPQVLVRAATSGGNPSSLRRSLNLWTVPYHALAGALIGLYSSSRTHLGWQSLIVIVPCAALFYRTYRVYRIRLDSQRDYARKIEGLYIRTIETLAMAIGAKDRQMENHLHRVQVYATAIGKELKLSNTEMKALEAAALLHDIGKLAVPDHIISKPGRLTSEEFDKIKIHPVVGAEILKRVQFPYPVVPYVRHHHERWDGSGYPDGLRGEDIPIGARILSAVDCLDALATDRQYRRALPLDRAVEQLVSEAGRSFDPRIVAVVKKRYRELEQLSEARARDAVAQRQNGVDGPGPRPFDQFVKAIGASTAEVQSLFELTQELGNSLSLPDTFGVLGPLVQKLVPATALVIYLKRRDRLHARHIAGDFPAEDGTQLELNLGEGPSGKVAVSGEPAFNADPARECKTSAVAAKLAGFQSLLSVPLTGTDSIIGCLTLYSDKPDAFTTEHLRRMKAMLPKLSQAVDNGMKFKQAEDRATTDHLTGLPNAHSLYLHLEQEISLARCMNSPLAIVVCDLNGFKAVNDNYGHLNGNRLLQAVAAGLKESCREYDFVSRMGGDEFVLVLTGLVAAQDVQAKIRQFREAIRLSANQVCGAGMIRGSFGAAMFPKNGVGADELLAHADREMYCDKDEQKRAEPFGWTCSPSSTGRGPALRPVVRHGSAT